MGATDRTFLFRRRYGGRWKLGERSRACGCSDSIPISFDLDEVTLVAHR